MRFLTLLVLGALSVSAALTSSRQPEYETFSKEPRVAVVIGINDHPETSGFPRLRFAVADAQAIAEALKENGYDVRLLLDREATQAGIAESVRTATASMKGKGTFLFYFAGSGAMDADGRQFLATYDSTAAGLTDNGTNMVQVVNMLRDSGVPRKVLMVDACSSQIAGEGVHRGPTVEPFPEPSPGIHVYTNQVAAQAEKTPGLFILNAASKGQASYEEQALGHGVFSYFVVDGFKGNAAGKDGLISFLDLADYVSGRVHRKSLELGHDQVPYEAGDFKSDFVLAGKLTAVTPPADATDTRGGKRPTPAPAASTGGVGARYALVIGINNYVSLDKLKTALDDAGSIGAELHDDYDFKVEPLKDPGRAAILSALNRYRRDLKADDTLLIYYAGHGYFDKDTNKAYWLPSDAQDNDNTNWIPTDDITTNLKGTAARHVLIISDSCYSGTLGGTRDPHVSLTGEAQKDREKYLANVAKRPSRQLMASGGNEPVLDGGGDGKHSIFATVLLRSLKEMESDKFTVQELFTPVGESVGGRSSQVPELDPLRDSGHDGGSFIFQRKPAK
jgi:uncharacterized caspase-like protein